MTEISYTITGCTVAYSWTWVQQLWSHWLFKNHGAVYGDVQYGLRNDDEDY